MSSILFKNSNYHRYPAFGQMLELALCCYVKGLELNCDDIYIEWQDIRFLWNDDGYGIGGFEVPRSDILPFSFVSHDEKIDVDYIIDVGLPNCLYDGCKPIISKTGYKMRTCDDYIKKYLKTHKDLPKIELKDYSGHSDKAFILLHYRESKKRSQQFRNVHPKWYMGIIRYIRRNYDIDIYKIGEPSRLDSVCDKIYSYFFKNVNKLFELANDCELYIGSPCGPCVVPLYLRKPTLLLVENHTSYESELGSFGPILSDNQHILMTNKDNYKLMRDVIDKCLGEYHI